ncbi:MAG: FHA domain-containing protein [Anaerolineae bacterium]|nr:FHA domain-containing protein [Anaerolineae bacterium]MDW8173959.1 FHA domain-containing protein [Anaerolineae bacterium]
MAYGRLDIYYADGRAETHYLEASHLTIGKSQDASIRLDDESISGHHLSIQWADGVVSLCDLESEGGTFIDGQPIGHQPVILAETEEIQIGTLRLIFQPLDLQATVPSSVQDTAVVPKLGFSASFDQRAVDVWPAAMTSVLLTLSAHGLQPLSLEIRASGLPEAYWRLSRRHINLDPREPSNVLLNFKPPRHPQTKPGRYTLVLDIIPNEQLDQAQRYELPVTVHPYGGFGVALSQACLKLDEVVTLYLHNQGSEAVSVTLSARSRDGSLGARFSLNGTTLLAGERGQVIVTPQALKRPLIGQPQVHELFIEVQAQTAARWLLAQVVRVEVPPRLKPWATLSLLGVGASLILLLLLGLLGLFAPRPARIDSLRLSASEAIEAGQPLVLEWQAENVESFILLVNDSPHVTLQPDQRRYELDTSLYPSGTLRLEIRAGQVNELIAAQASIELRRTLHDVTLSVQPLTVPRNVQTSLSIQWSVVNALEVRLEGLELFSEQLLPDLSGIGGAFAVFGRASQPFDIILRAIGEREQRLEARQRVTVADALCQSRTELMSRAGPGDTYPPLRTLPANRLFNTVGRDEANAWAQLEVEGEVLWVRADALACQGFRTEQLPILRDALLPSTVSPMAQPTPATQASPTPR